MIPPTRKTRGQGPVLGPDQNKENHIAVDEGKRRYQRKCMFKNVCKLRRHYLIGILIISDIQQILKSRESE